MSAFAHELPFGAELVAGGTRFRLWAPDLPALRLELADDRGIDMQRDGEGWFSVTAPCGAGARYRFRTPSGVVFPDPASRLQCGDVHGWSVVVDPASYAWDCVAWKGRPWHEAVICEVHAGLCGGYRGLAQRLPDLAGLGVSMIELMPIADFPGQRNWGYDGVLPFAPDETYGTPGELKGLVDRAHALGLGVMLDVVYNHFGPDGNWLGSYASAFFRNDVATPWGAAIDFRRPEVRRFFIENALYWLMEYRFDGLRLDAVHAIAAPDWLDGLAAEVHRRVEPGRHVHLVLEHDGNSARHLSHGFDAQWNDDVHHVLHHLLTGEAGGYYADHCDDPATRLARCLRDGFDYQGEVSAHRGGKRRGEPSGHLAPTAFVAFLQNHDQIGNRALGERLAALCPDAALQAATALILLSPQIPLFFMGDECGARSPFLFFTDHHGALADAVREGRRREFASFAAFADPAGRAAIPDPNDPATYERSRVVADASETDRWRGLYRDLLQVRRTEIVPRLAGARSIDAESVGEKAVVARWRMGDGSCLAIVLNLADRACTRPAPGGRMLYATDGFGSAPSGIMPAFSLAAWHDA
jgi:maltooligosyltrehalose trehalohydrolase